MDIDTDAEPTEIEDREDDIESDRDRVLEAETTGQFRDLRIPADLNSATAADFLTHLDMLQNTVDTFIRQQFNSVPLEYSDVVEEVIAYLRGQVNLNHIQGIIADDPFWGWYSWRGTSFFENLARAFADENHINQLHDTVYTKLNNGEYDAPEGGGRGGGSLIPTRFL